MRSAANGTSSIGGNDQWYAVCYLSGQGDPFTAAGKAGIVDAVNWLREKGGAGSFVNGHRDHHPTECPGDVIYGWLRVASFTPRATTPTTPTSPEADMPYLDWPQKDRDALVRDVANAIKWADIFPAKRRMTVVQALRGLVRSSERQESTPPKA